MCCHTPQDKKEKKAYVITRNGHVFQFNNNYSECKSVRLSSTSEAWYIRHQLQKSPMFMLHTIFPPHLTPFVSLGLHMCRCFSALLFTSSHQKEEAKRPHFENCTVCVYFVLNWEPTDAKTFGIFNHSQMASSNIWPQIKISQWLQTSL